MILSSEWAMGWVRKASSQCWLWLWVTEWPSSILAFSRTAQLRNWSENPLGQWTEQCLGNDKSIIKKYLENYIKILKFELNLRNLLVLNVASNNWKIFMKTLTLTLTDLFSVFYWTALRIDFILLKMGINYILPTENQLMKCLYNAQFCV